MVSMKTFSSISHIYKYPTDIKYSVVQKFRSGRVHWGWDVEGPCNMR